MNAYVVILLFFVDSAEPARPLNGRVENEKENLNFSLGPKGTTATKNIVPSTRKKGFETK